ncbi:MAG: signal peptidase I [Candidatus Niyogibacteria bacterium]|nr:signal peptidase I [Candidatus Niyogibacteria bacterium]
MNEERAKEISYEKKEGVEKLPEGGDFFWRDVIRFTLIAICIVLPIRIFIIQPFIVSGASMHPTFETGDYLIVDEIGYRLQEPTRGEVVIFKYPNDPSKFFIKRIIGLPGETLQSVNGALVIKDAVGNKQALNEAYLHELPKDTFSITLTNDEYFVMGDNRGASFDSRIWGALPRHFIVGRAWVRLFPLSEIGVWPGISVRQ